jgi:hypothetical protein
VRRAQGPVQVADMYRGLACFEIYPTCKIETDLSKDAEMVMDKREKEHETNAKFATGVSGVTTALMVDQISILLSTHIPSA